MLLFSLTVHKVETQLCEKFKDSLLKNFFNPSDEFYNNGLFLAHSVSFVQLLPYAKLQPLTIRITKNAEDEIDILENALKHLGL